VFALVRENCLDQAISRAVASATNIWHRNEKAVKGKDIYADVNVPTKALNMEILTSLPVTVRQNQAIRQIVRDTGPMSKLITYENLAASVEETSELICKHAVANGFTPARDLAKRSLRKLIDEDRSKEIKAHFRQFMQRHMGQDFFDV